MQIDWLTVGAQIVNFLVLVWLLQRFLYRPITDAMARREERIETRLAEAKAARSRVEAEAEKLREKHAALEASREEMLREAMQEAETLRKESVDELHSEMEARRKTWEDRLQEERDDFAARLRHRAGHQVVDIVGRVLRDFTDSDLSSQIAGPFVHRLADLDAEARAKLKAAAERAGGQVRIDSSVALEAAIRSQITRAIREHIAPDIEVEYFEDGDLLLGLRLRIGEQTLEWSATRFLRRLETTLDEVIEGGARRHARRTPASGDSS